MKCIICNKSISKDNLITISKKQRDRSSDDVHQYKEIEYYAFLCKECDNKIDWIEGWIIK
jgi:uncharacterized protein YlaI